MTYPTHYQRARDRARALHTRWRARRDPLAETITVDQLADILDEASTIYPWRTA